MCNHCPTGLFSLKPCLDRTNRAEKTPRTTSGIPSPAGEAPSACEEFETSHRVNLGDRYSNMNCSNSQYIIARLIKRGKQGNPLAINLKAHCSSKGPAYGVAQTHLLGKRRQFEDNTIKHGHACKESGKKVPHRPKERTAGCWILLVADPTCREQNDFVPPKKS